MTLNAKQYFFQSLDTTKGQVYPTIISLLQSAGWVNVSSNPATDFDVMQSEFDDKKLVIQMRPTNISNTNNTTTSDQPAMSFRMIEGYVPGVPGSAGIFDRPAEIWRVIHNAPIGTTTTTISRNTPVTILYNVNKRRLIMAILYPKASGYGSIINYIGIPDEEGIFCTEPGSRGLIVGTSYGGPAHNQIASSNSPQELAAETASNAMYTSHTMTLKSPNHAAKYFPGVINYGYTATAPRGSLTGIYVLATGSDITEGDIVEIEGRKFFCVVCNSATANSFGTSANTYNQFLLEVL